MYISVAEQNVTVHPIATMDDDEVVLSSARKPGIVKGDKRFFNRSARNNGTLIVVASNMHSAFSF